MKKNNLVTISIFLITLLSSCNLFHRSSTIIDYEPFQNDNGEGYEKLTDFKFNLQDVNKTFNKINLPSVGKSSILIVPVQANDAPEWTTGMLSNVNIAFFGSAEETGWQSVSSYYQTSSYGKLLIDGEVAPILKIDYTIKDLANSYMNGNKHQPDHTVINIFKDSTIYNTYRQKYDKNGDGFIDSIVFVYSNKIDNDNGYWAWVSRDNSTANLSNPSINSYMWVSYNFIYGNQYAYEDTQLFPYASYGNKVDAHTIIHETGHLLGLDDYYCTDSVNAWDPSGSIEMHANNIGDENIYSKLALGWVEPYYVNLTNSGIDSLTLKLRSSAKYGDAILINDFWNKTPMDEYLLIEYYTPHYLNYQDSLKPYAGNGFQMYSVSGFRIYHIDSRIVKLKRINERNVVFAGFSDELEDGEIYTVGPSNSESLSYLNEHKGDYKLVHLMEAGGINTFIKQIETKKPHPATNNTLFTTGNSFKATNAFFYNNDKFNDATRVGYRIIINDNNEDFGSIRIERI